MRFEYALEEMLSKEAAKRVVVTFRRIRGWRWRVLEVELSARRKRLYLTLGAPA